VHYLNEILETDIKPNYEKSRSGEVKHSLADVSKARSLLNFKPEINFEQGLNKPVDWFTSVG